MSAPFDTLQLARGFEAAGFPLDQAGKMAEAVAKATIGADLATKTDLRELEQRLTIRVGGMLIIAVVILLTGLGTATSILLNRLPTATPPALHTNSAPAGIVLAADTSGVPPREPYSCRLFADEQRKCAFGSCDPRPLERLKRECLRDGGRP
jgi:hypothetical protein